MTENDLKNDKKLPQVFDYISPIDFLKDFFAFHKNKTPGFTYESWASDLGFKSRSFIKMILTEERKITPHFVEVFCLSNQFLNIEQSYFSLLVSHHQSVDPEEKNYYLDRILEIKSQNRDIQILSEYDIFLSNPDLPLLLNILSFKDIHKSTQNLAFFLEKDPQTIESYLLILQKIQAAYFDPNTQQWNSNHDSFKVPPNAHNQALISYHNNSLKEAMLAQSLPAHVRRFRSLFIPLSADDYNNLLADVDQFVTKIKSKYDSPSLDCKSVYKMNLNFFPRTSAYQAHSKPFSNP